MTRPAHRKLRSKPAARQRGMTSVEFAIVGATSMLILFGCLEVSRLLFTVNVLEEATRRAARVAAVCTIDSSLIAETAVFNSSGGGVLPNLTTDNVQVEYLGTSGAAVANPPVISSIEYVRVQIINYEHELIIPGFSLSFMTRGYPTTIPSESLGKVPTGQTNSC